MSANRRWLDAFVQSPPIEELRGHYARRSGGPRAGSPPPGLPDSVKRVVVENARGSASLLAAGALARATGRDLLYVTAHLDEADDALEDAQWFTADEDQPLEAYRLAALEVLPGETGIALDLLAERLALIELIHERTRSSRSAEAPASATLYIAPIQALMQAVPAAEHIDRYTRSVGAGQRVDPADLSRWLTDAGYQRLDAIEQLGDFAVRGGIMDIFTPTLGPVRIDFFGDEIESIHGIDPDTMASTDRLERVSLVGATPDKVQQDEEAAACFIDLLPPDTICVLHEAMELGEQARGYYERLTNPRGIYAPGTVFEKLIARDHAELNQYSQRPDAPVRIELPCEPLPSMPTDARRAVADLGRLATGEGQADGPCAVSVICRREAEAQRLGELLDTEAPEARDRIAIGVGYLHRGYVWRGEGEPSRVVMPHHELFHRYETRRRVRRVSAGTSGSGDDGSRPGGSRGDAFLDLNVGDYVVHVDHGVARFTGLKSMRRGGIAQEFLTLEFADRAVLHVPATQIELIQKYVGGFEGKPPLSTLGGKRWKKTKEDVSEAVRELARKLLQVQAARQTQPGIRYPADTAWMKEFEAEFPFDETEDQLAAIAAVKRDMAQDRPMDRLICGDVGFGKTEVAMRAAFKAVEFGKQVAVLVPTTVLAEQHLKTFQGRMADYPFRVESISRFKTDAEARELLKAAQLGQVDVLIGTHRLLSRDVKFSDLGMVIVDEEQRFGVEHKNRLLELRLTADVLTLTATPIPRTLHMAMVGLRDISSLSAAPVDRRAVVTEVVPYDEKRIRQAIIRELSREGQCFFVHNRVHNIQSVADDIHRLVPDARIIIGHGQMASRELEKVMLAFTRREYDILVCTTIIESGIDIPTANTMFINRADQFGLAELHQLRGRVGRYKHRAYCYLLLPPDRPVTDIAARRLKAIEQYTMLGAGFKIAMRDLEIRGAGNLLGAEQSGHIAAVGYEMYCTMLDHETRRLRREPIIEPTRTHLELPVAGQIPKRYIRSDKHRMDAYRRLSRAEAFDRLDGVVQSLTDAYGPMPGEVQRLVELAEVRLAASTLGVDEIKLEGQDLIFTAKDRITPADDAGRQDGAPRLVELLEAAPGRTTVLDEKTVYWRPPAGYTDEMATLLAVLRKLMVRPLRASAQESSARGNGADRSDLAAASSG